MKSFVDKLNLKSSELRFLGLVALVVFAMLNVWLVWPHFYEWATAKDEIAKSRKKLKDWQVRIERRPQQEEVLRRLEKQGPTALMEGQAGNLLASIEAHMRMNNIIDRGKRVFVNQNAPTNQFFEEFAYTVNIAATNEALINFLLDLASPNSMIRVREMKLDRDAATGGTLLAGSLRIVASYAKKPPAPAPAAAPPTPGARSTITKAATNSIGISRSNAPGRRS